jgi:protein tyrosine phosphatase
MFYLVRKKRFFFFVEINLYIPDDDTRVRLQRGSNDYINANFVEVPWANRSYILTQVCL